MKEIFPAAILVTLALSGPALFPAYVVSGFSRTGAAQQTGNDLFQQALSKERAEGRLDEAIQIYERITKEFAADRALVAKALLQMAASYERLGNTDARRVYERIVRDYSDQKETAAVARAHLALPDDSRDRSPISRRLWAGSANDISGGSTDGRVVVFTNRPSVDLAVLDLSTGRQRRLTQKSDVGDRGRLTSFEQFPLLSPDGRQVAYSWLSLQTNLYELRVVGTADGSTPRTVYGNPELPVIAAAGWSADGTQLLVGASRRDGSGLMGLLPADGGGALRVVKSSSTNRGSRMSLSPDGRYIAYDVPQADGGPERDITVVATDGSREIPLVRHPAHDAKPMWTPDGKSVLFFSDRNGTLGLWSVSVVDGRAQGAPALIQANVGLLSPLGFSRTGGFHYAVPGGGGSHDLLVAEMDLETGRLISDPTPIVSRYGRPTQRPDWSRDGRSLAFEVATSPFARTGPLVIVVRDMETGRERAMNQSFRTLGTAPKWRPDGQKLLVGGLPADGPAQSLQLDVATGAASPLPGHAKWEECGYPQWSTAGDAVLCQVGKEEIVWRHVDSGEEMRRVRFEHTSANVPLSPDGRWLAFLGRDLRTLYFIAVDGGAPREVFRLGGTTDSLTLLSWTPDSRYLLCLGEGTEIWRVPVSGGDTRKISIPLKGLRQLRVHPDGRHVAMLVETPGSEIWSLENFLPAATSRVRR